VATGTLNSQGKYQGGVSTTGGEGVVLDFGRPAYNGTYYGFILFNAAGTFVTFAQVQAAAEAFEDGYWGSTYGHSHTLGVYIGTNDSYLACTGCTDPLPAADMTSFGQGLNHMGENIYNYAYTHGYSTIFSGGAIDAEPAYDPNWTNTSHLITGFNGGGYAMSLMDFGSMDGSVNGSLWTAIELYEASYGGGISGYQDDLPIGEIYSSSLASEWAGLYQWGEQNYGQYIMQGVMVECLSGSGCYTYSTAWNATLTDIHNLGYPGATISWTTDIGQNL
jgi:hypothetical protein